MRAFCILAFVLLTTSLGAITAFGAEYGSIVIGSNSSLKISGLSGATLSGLNVGDNEDVTIDSSGKVISKKKAPAKEESITPNQGLLLSDDFSDIESGWSKKSSNPNKSSLGYKNGEYHITVFQKDTATSSWLARSFSDFIIEVEATLESGPNNNDYGVIFRRLDEDNYYRFKISGEGEYGFDKLQDAKWIDIIPWTQSAAIKAGRATNLIKVECNRDKFTFYVNGNKLGYCTDNSFASGSIGLEARAYDTPNVHVSFDNLKVWAAGDYSGPSVVISKKETMALDDSITVCHEGCGYSSIQAAIDAAEPKELIKVYSGTYNENLVIAKDVQVLGIDSGNGKPILNGGIDPRINLIPLSNFIIMGPISVEGELRIRGHDNVFKGDIAVGSLTSDDSYKELEEPTNFGGR